MAQIIDMPKLSDTMTVGTLVKWLKQEGAAVKTGDMLAEVETDKATMELESFFDGTLLRHFVAAGRAGADRRAALRDRRTKGEKVEAAAVPAPAAPPEARNRIPETGYRHNRWKPRSSDAEKQGGGSSRPDLRSSGCPARP